MSKEPQDFLEEGQDLFESKNEDYADTWVITGIALSMLHEEPIELDNFRDHIINGNTHRLLDKILRGYHAALSGNEPNHEAAQDSFYDAMVYSAMIASALEGDERSWDAMANSGLVIGEPELSEAIQHLKESGAVSDFEDVDEV